MSDTELHELIEKRVRASEQLYTAGRRRLVSLLDEADGPLTTPEILESDRKLSQSSVYRNLAALESAGVVARLVTTGEFACYELTEDLTEHHHHLICAGCGAVEDFLLPDEVESDLDDALRSVAGRSGFSADHHRLDLVGYCTSCSR